VKHSYLWGNVDLVRERLGTNSNSLKRPCHLDPARIFATEPGRAKARYDIATH
jgi:hypothetical protein